MKNMSKFLLAGVLALSMSVPVFADRPDEPEVVVTDVESISDGEEGQAVESEAVIDLPTVKVTLPTSHGFIVNPYNLEDAGQIISAEATIVNASEVDVKVSLKSVAAAIEGKDSKSKAVLAAITDKTTAKTVELNLVVETETGTLHAPEAGLLITDKVKATDLVTIDKTNGEAILKYEGKTIANPVGNPWSDADTIKVTSIYSFAPVVETTP